MKLNIGITETVSAKGQELLRSVSGEEPIRAASRGVANETRDFYAGLEQTRPNKQGWPRQLFWAAVRRSVQNPTIASPTFATVSITEGRLEQRVRGGYIRPGPGKKYLTLPAIPEAYGRRAREFHNLRFGFAENRYGNLAPALVEDSAQRVSFGRRRKDGTRKVIPGEEVGGKAFYFLVQKVYQPPDPTTLPTEVQLQVAANYRLGQYVKQLEDRANRLPPAPQKGPA